MHDFPSCTIVLRPSLEISNDPKSMYQTVRGVIIKSSNFRNAKFELFPALLRIDKRKDYLNDPKTIVLLKTIAKLMYIHDKLVTEELFDDLVMMSCTLRTLYLTSEYPIRLAILTLT